MIFIRRERLRLFGVPDHLPLISETLPSISILSVAGRSVHQILIYHVVSIFIFLSSSEFRSWSEYSGRTRIGIVQTAQTESGFLVVTTLI